MLIKICGLKNIDTINCCEKNKVDFFGMIFYNKSPRYINLDQAAILVEHSKNMNIEPIGVFVDEKIEKLQTEVAKKLGYKLVDHKL